MGLLRILIQLLLVAVLLYVIIYIYQAVRRAMNQFNNPLQPTEACPACQRRIQVSGDNMVCPHCDTKLGRTPDGNLSIRVN